MKFHSGDQKWLSGVLMRFGQMAKYLSPVNGISLTKAGEWLSQLPPQLMLEGNCRCLPNGKDVSDGTWGTASSIEQNKPGDSSVRVREKGRNLHGANCMVVHRMAIDVKKRAQTPAAAAVAAPMPQHLALDSKEKSNGR